MVAIIIGIMACTGMPFMLAGMDIGIFIIDCTVMEFPFGVVEKFLL
jgi:hypothetical protein